MASMNHGGLCTATSHVFNVLPVDRNILLLSLILLATLATFLNKKKTTQKPFGLDESPLASQNDFGITFEIKKDGKLVTDLQKYLGALGHTVVLREGDLQFIHGHPTQGPDVAQNGKVTFMTTFPEAGYYKLFSQFQREGKVFTSDFVVNIIEGTKSSPGGMMMHERMQMHQ